MTDSVIPEKAVVPFTISETGHIIIEAWLENALLRLVVDTAAGGAFIFDSKEARLLSIAEQPNSENNDVKGLGTSSHTMKLLIVPSIRIGDAIILNPECVSLDLSHVMQAGGPKGLHGLLGGLFLRRHLAIIDYTENKLYFSPKAILSEIEG